MAGGHVRRIGKVAGLACGALLISSCIVGETDGARMVSNTSATLEGRLGTTADGQGTYWFEYGPTTDYDKSTPPSTSAVIAGKWAHVSQEVADLEPGTTYHFRLCGRSPADQGTCGPDKTVTTGVARGRVRGSGGYYNPGPYPPITAYSASLSLDVIGDLDGGPHLEGDVSYSATWPGTPATGPLRTDGQGPPDCVRIEGNRATVGFIYFAFFPWDGYRALTFIIEDNGPTGDRVLIDEDALELCPDPTSATGSDMGPGNFIVEGG